MCLSNLTQYTHAKRCCSVVVIALQLILTTFRAVWGGGHSLLVFILHESQSVTMAKTCSMLRCFLCLCAHLTENTATVLTMVWHVVVHIREITLVFKATVCAFHMQAWHLAKFSGHCCWDGASGVACCLSIPSTCPWMRGIRVKFNIFFSTATDHMAWNDYDYV